MRRSHSGIVLVALLFALGLHLGPAAAEEPLHAAVLERPSTWTRGASGAARLLKEAGCRVTELDLKRSPKAQAVDLLVFGSFCSESADYRRYIRKYAEAIRKFIEDGGVVCQFTQADQTEPRVPFLTAGIQVSRCDQDLDPVFVVDGKHPLLAQMPRTKADKTRLALGRPFGRPANWESISAFAGAHVLASSDATNRRPAVVEAAHGKGRVVITSLHVDALYGEDGALLASALQEEAGKAFAAGLMRWTAQVREGRASQVVPTKPWAAQPLGMRVNDAIKRGVAALRKLQKKDGSFGGWARLDVTAFAVYALLHSGAPPEDRAIQLAVKWMRRQEVKTTYAAATLIFALHTLGRKADESIIQKAAAWLVATVHKQEGVWAYPIGPDLRYARTDLSNTHFAVLGLWVAERHQYTAPAAIWADLAKEVPRYQNADGGFRYSMNRDDPHSTMSMTTAGITVLTLALERLKPRLRRGRTGAKLRSALKNAWAFMDRRFRADGNAIGGHLWHTKNRVFNLYGIERIATLTGRKQIAGRNWYREGAGYLLARQRDNGTWRDAVADTCLALLFLRRATLTYTAKTEQEGDAGAPKPAPSDSEAASPSAGPLRPQVEVPYVRNWFLLGPFAYPGDAEPNTKPPIRETGVKPQEHRKIGGRRWIRHRSDADRISLSKVLGQKNNSVSYAFTWLHADADAEIVLWFGQDDAGRVFLDDEVVYDDPFIQGGSPLGRPIRVRLSKGAHRLLIRIEEWDQGSKFYLRIAGPDGWPAETVRASLHARR